MLAFGGSLGVGLSLALPSYTMHVMSQTSQINEVCEENAMIQTRDSHCQRSHVLAQFQLMLKCSTSDFKK